MNKERGIVLTVMVVLNTLLLLYGLLDTNVNFFKNLSDWYFWHFLIDFLATLAALIGIWVLKKWGVYLLLIVMGVGLLAGYFTSKNTALITHELLSSIILTFLWSWAIYRKWGSFS